MDAFKDKYHVIAITIKATHSIKLFCQAVNKILNQEKIKKNIILYGLSVGGILAQSYIRLNKEKVDKLIISHASAPRSSSYRKRIIIPLMVVNVILPLIPLALIKSFGRKAALKLQGGSNKHRDEFRVNTDETTRSLLSHFNKEFYKKSDKELLKTWIDLHMDFFHNEKLSPDDLNDWNGKILILRTDNDPFAQDDGEFNKLYPNAQVYTFHGTGHLTFQFQFEKIVEVIKTFLRSK